MRKLIANNLKSKKQINFRQSQILTSGFISNCSSFQFSSLNIRAMTKQKQSSFLKIQSFSFSNNNLPNHQVLTLPSLSPSMEVGAIAEWKKKEGDSFKAGEALCSIETDKATVDFEMNESGFLAKIIKPVGSKDVPLGEAICIIVDKKSDVEAFKNYVLAKEVKSEIVNNKDKQEVIVNSTSNTKSNENHSVETKNNKDKIFASPLAKKTSAEIGVDISSIEGTGPNGRIINADVLEHKDKIKSTHSQPKSEINTQLNSQYEELPVSQIRKVIASRLLESKTTIPHFYLNSECNVDKLLVMREKLNKVSPVKISINDIIIKACAIACEKVPEANSSWNGSTIRKNKSVDISVAVQTDNGLITPIVFNANTKRLGEISKNIKDLAAKAKEGKLKPQEFQGGTFTVSNLGMFGITSFSAIINPGQSCILAVGKSEKKVVLNEEEKEEKNKFKVVNVINVTLSCDHRVVDGAVGAKWVSEFRSLIEDPALLLL